MLYLFYKYFHPWVSEGISVGFEPGREKRKDMMENVYDLKDNMDDRAFTSSNVENEYTQSEDLYGIILLQVTII